MRPATPDEIRSPTISKAQSQYRPVNQFLGRVQRATIQSVNTSDGTCTIAYEATPSDNTGVNIPMFFFSLGPDGQRNTSAWHRYMPFVGDIVLVGFDPNGQPRILGYDLVSYSYITQLNSTLPGFGFNALQSGEWDMMSTGGAYLKGDNNGVLTLVGGIQLIRLDKQRAEIDLQTGLEKLTTGSSTFRRGTVRRSPIPLYTEVGALGNVPGVPSLGVPPIATPANAVLPSLWESTDDIKAPVTGLPFGLPVVFRSIGNIMDPDVDLITGGAYGAAGPLGVKTVKTTGMHARVMFRVYDSVPGLSDTPVGTPGPVGGSAFRPFEYAIDTLGNLIINQGLLATEGINVWAPLKTSLFTTSLELSAAITQIGNVPTAVEPVICGNLFLTATTTFCSALTAYVTASETFGAATSTYLAASSTYLAAQGIYLVGRAAFDTVLGSGTPTTFPAAYATFAPIQVAWIAASNAYASATSTYAAASATYNSAGPTFTAAITSYVSAVTAALSKAVFVSLSPSAIQPATVPSLFQI
jgi:hypothetical protein